MGPRKSETVNHIIESTMRLLSIQESVDIRVAEIAKEANVGESMVYYHFGSRDALIAQAQLRLYENLVKGREEIFERLSFAIDNDDYIAGLACFREIISEAYLSGNQANEFPSKMIEDVHKHSSTTDRISDSVDRRLLALLALTKRAQDKGWVRGDIVIESAIVLIWSSSVGMPSMKTLGVYNPDFDQIVTLLVDLLFTGRIEVAAQ